MLCSKEAAKFRIRPGMNFAQAKALSANLLSVEYNSDLYAALQSSVVQQLLMVSPHISSMGSGIFMLDASGLTHLGGEKKFCISIQKIIESSGFPDIHIGIADTVFAAQVASKFKKHKHYIVPAAKDRDFLAPLSVHHLPMSEEFQETLSSLGIKTISQLLQIPLDELQKRFGKEGLKAYDLACGFDARKPQSVQMPVLYESALDLNFPVESLAQTQFILKSMLESICSKLIENELLAEELVVSFYNDSTKFDCRPLQLIRPSNKSKFLLEIIRLSLEAVPLIREFTGLHIEVRKHCPESYKQNKLSQKEEPLKLAISIRDERDKADADKKHANKKQENKRSESYAKTRFVAESKNDDAQAEPFALLLSKFITRMGTKSVLRPLPCDQHIPDLAASFLPVLEEARSVLPVNISSANTAANTSAAALACGLVLKKSATPEPVLVEYQGKAPRSITYRGRWHRIKELTEPEKLSGLWWEQPLRRSYYVALLEAAVERKAANYLVLLVHDHENNSWQLDGFFD